MRRWGFLLFFALGFFSLLAQSLVVREFILSFGGNELGIGLFYFFWFIWVGLGALLGLGGAGQLCKKHFLNILPFYPALGFIELLLFMNLRLVAGVHWWEFFALEKVFLYLFLFTSFISFFTGLIFTVGTAWLKERDKRASQVIAGAFVWESIGSFAAGCAFTWLSYKLFLPIPAFIFGAILFFLCATGVSIGFKARTATLINISFLLVSLSLLFAHNDVVRFSNTTRMKNFLPRADFVAQAYTPYRHVLVGKMPSQLAVAIDGEIISNIPDIVDADAQAALFMAQTGSVRDILICSQGAENLILSFLKFPQVNITYLAEDKAYYESLMMSLPEEIRKALNSPRLNVVFVPAREFLAHRQGGFDLAVIYASNPSNLLSNAYFTDDFFRLIKNDLSAHGVMAVRFLGGENFITSEAANCGASLYYTMSSVFDKVIITPGSSGWFFAGGKDSLVSDDGDVLFRRIDGRLPADFSFSAQNLRSLFLPDRVRFVRDSYTDGPLYERYDLINRDNDPRMFFLNLIAAPQYSGSWQATLLKRALTAGWGIFAIPLLVFFAARILFLKRIKSFQGSRIKFNARILQMFCGFCGFSLQLILIYIFQIKFSTIFSLIGLVCALFMLGLGVGGAIGGYLSRRYRAMAMARVIVFAQMITIIAIYIVFVLAGVNNFWVFLTSFVLTGLLTGASYPLSAGLLETAGADIAKTAVYLELFDHLGAALAGILIGVFLTPLLGIGGVLCFVLVAATLVFILFALESRNIVIIDANKDYYPPSFPWVRSYYIMGAVAISLVLCVKLSKVTSDAGTQNISAQGFGGTFLISAQMTSDGVIKKLTIRENNETAAYIKKMPQFLAQFYGRNIKEGFTIGKNVDAITGATITSRGVVNALNKAAGKKEHSDIGIGIYGVMVFGFLFVLIYAFLPQYHVARKVYLVLTVLILGLSLNFLFSSYHLASLFDFNFFSCSPVAVLIIFILIFSLLFGPVWCGWLCPFGALQELLSFTLIRRDVSRSLDRQARFFKYILLFIFVVFWFLKIDSLFFADPLEYFFMHGFIFSWGRVLGLAGLIGSIFFLRFWCRYFCWCGAFISLFNRFALLKRYFPKRYTLCPMHVLNIRDTDCLQCNICLQSDAGCERKTADRTLKFIFASVLFIAIMSALSNAGNVRYDRPRQQSIGPSESMQRADTEHIQGLINEGKLSDHEAKYYKKLDK